MASNEIVPLDLQEYACELKANACFLECEMR